MEFDMNKMGEMLAQAQEMQQAMDLRLSQTIVEADSGGGAVSVRMNGKKELLRLTMAPSAAASAGGDISLLEDLIVAAVNAAARKADEAQNSNATNMLGGLGLPGF
jgi:DNA-binding YbaB/EbfC family protein